MLIKKIYKLKLCGFILVQDISLNFMIMMEIKITIKLLSTIFKYFNFINLSYKRK